MIRLIQTSILAAVALMLTPAIADDGTYEISPLCVATGCFDGDGPGFPVTISRPGRYVLTGNLDVRNEPTPENATGISVSGSNHVSIDLNGFEIRGPVSCAGQPLSCSPTGGAGDGVAGSNSVNVTVQNGSITGMGRYGVLCASNGSRCRVDGLTLSQNGADGLTGGPNWVTVTNTKALSNGGTGLNMSLGAVRDTEVRGNGGIGVLVNQATLESVTAVSNGSDGIASSGVVENSSALQNGGNGINCFGCIATFNVVENNTGFGLRLANSALFGGNRAFGNTAGDADVAGSTTVILPNRCLDASC